MIWISTKDRLPELVDDNVLVYFSKMGTIDLVYIEDYFKDMNNGFDEKGNQLYAKWYKIQGVTHWMKLPEIPEK